MFFSKYGFVSLVSCVQKSFWTSIRMTAKCSQSASIELICSDWKRGNKLSSSRPHEDKKQAFGN